MTGRGRSVLLIAGSCAIAAAITLAVLMLLAGRHQEIQPQHAAAMPPAAQAVLQKFIARATQQQDDLASYSDVETVHATLPALGKQADYVLERHYVAPRQLTFKPVTSSGDGFVKHDVILGYLSRQQQHVREGNGEESAITPANYNFEYIGERPIESGPAIIFAVHPLRRGPGLFDGRIYVNSQTGMLLRAEGEFVQSPSTFVKTLRFLRITGFSTGLPSPYTFTPTRRRDWWGAPSWTSTTATTKSNRIRTPRHVDPRDSGESAKSDIAVGVQASVRRVISVSLIMVGEIMVLVFGLALCHGWLWSVAQRRSAVQAAYDEIRNEVRRERRNVDYC